VPPPPFVNFCFQKAENQTIFAPTDHLALACARASLISLARWARKERREETIEARVVREEPPSYPAEAYSPPAHFDLLLEAKHDIGRIRGAAGSIGDAAIARQFRALADAADQIHARLMAEPVKLGLARRFFASYLPRSADLAEGYHRLPRRRNRSSTASRKS